MINREINDELKAYWELIHEGSLTVADAVKMYCSEHQCSLTYCIQIGIIGYMRTAEVKE